jgi:thiamine kinase-like enzyme
MKELTVLPPNWWKHSIAAWQAINDFFYLKKISTSDLNNIDLWMKIENGISNHSYQLTVSNEHYFIQITNSNKSLSLPEKTKSPSSFYFYHSSLSQWLVNNLLKTNEVVINEWFFNNSFNNEFLEQNKFIDSLLDFFCTLHTLKKESLPELPILNINQHLKKYKKLSINNNANAKTHQEEIESLYQLAQKSSVHFDSSHICHNDLSLTNILWNIKDEELRVIDWEYACISDPIMDLASLILYCQLNRQQEQKLLRRYEIKMAIIINPAKLKDMKTLSKSLSELWELAH